MSVGRFCLYEEVGKKGILDYKTNKVILHHSYDVCEVEDRVIHLKDGSTLLLDDILKKVDFISNKKRFIIVEDDNTKLLGIYDTKINSLKVNCIYEKIEYSLNKNGFTVWKNGKKRELAYVRLKKLKYYSNEDKNILVNNLSVYHSKPFVINTKTGKKVEIHR